MVRRRVCVVLALVGVLVIPGMGWSLFGASPRPNPGEESPRFQAPLLRGGEFDLGRHIGRDAVLLDFWSIYCVSCIQAMPKLIELHDRYAAKGLVIVGVNLDSFATKRVVRFVEGLDFRVPFPLVLDKTREAAAKFGVSVLPTTVLIGRDGKVADYHVGYAPGDEDAFEAAIRRALGLQP